MTSFFFSIYHPNWYWFISLLFRILKILNDEIRFIDSKNREFLERNLQLEQCWEKMVKNEEENGVTKKKRINL